MSKRKEELISEMRAMHNDIGINAAGELRRLIGFYEDDEDYYYHVQDVWGEEQYCSAVGKFISLKGRLDQDDYASLDEMFELNGGRPTTEFLVQKAGSA
jgi:hypothetical protein